MLIFAKRGWMLVQTGRQAYDQWKQLPDAERERTRESADRVASLTTELSGVLVKQQFKRGSRPGAREPDVITRELQVALAELATGPAGQLALGSVRTQGVVGRAALGAARFAHKRVGRRMGQIAAIDRAKEAAGVGALLETLRENHRSGLTDEQQQTKGKLVKLGADAVPALVAALEAPRPDTSTPQSEVEDGVANDIADVLGEIGDPAAVDALMDQFERYIVSAQRALAKFPAGLEALLAGLDDPEEYIRGCCIQGLGFATVERDRAAAGLAKALGDPNGHNREQAALAAQRLAIPDPDLLRVLEQLALEDPSERVRMKAQSAFHELT